MTPFCSSTAGASQVRETEVEVVFNTIGSVGAASGAENMTDISEWRLPIVTLTPIDHHNWSKWLQWYVPYSRKIWWWIKVGSLGTKFKSASTIAIMILGSTAKFNPRQNFPAIWGNHSKSTIKHVDTELRKVISALHFSFISRLLYPLLGTPKKSSLIGKISITHHLLVLWVGTWEWTVPAQCWC